jgi:hypothetical protein
VSDEKSRRAVNGSSARLTRFVWPGGLGGQGAWANSEGNDEKGNSVPILCSVSEADVTAREYGRGLGYPPGVTIVLASIIIAACALAVVGCFSIKLSWWRQDHKERSPANNTPRDNRPSP